MSRLIRILALLMLLAAPLRPVAAGPPVVTLDRVEAAIDLGHCDGAPDVQKGQPVHHNHCSIAAPGLPVAGGAAAPVPPLEISSSVIFDESALRSLAPEATTPPPRQA